MGKARRLQRQAQSGGAVTASKSLSGTTGEDFYSEPTLDVGDVSNVVKTGAEPQYKKRLTARQKKKLEKVLEKKQKNAVRAQLISDLQAAQLPPEQLQYMRRTADLGQQRETLKQKLRRELNEERAGLPVSADSRLHQKLHKRSAEIASDDEQVEPSAKKKTKATASKPASGGGGFLSFALSSMNDFGLAGGVNKSASESESDSEDEKYTDDYSDDDTTDDEEEKEKKSDIELEEEEEQIEVKETTRPAPEPKSAPPRPKSKPVPMEEREKAVYVTVVRDPEIQAARLKLPIIGEEQIIMETVRASPFVILCGETGSGKTTQLPQFLYEAGFASGKGDFPGLIGVTEPRRVATISMSERVGKELNDSTLTGYQIRYSGTVTDKTRIKFMTDGVLLKEIERDFLLRKYSAIIIDEAHERSLNTDILIGLLSRIVPLRLQMSQEKNASILPIRLIIMSATLRVEDFTQNTRLFPQPPPVIEVASRQFPVTIHFNRRTPHNDYLREAYKKVCKIHERLPEGGVLVFVTSQQDIGWLCRKLRKRYSTKKSIENDKADANKDNIDLNAYPVLPGARKEAEAEQQYDIEEEEAAAELADSAVDADDDIDGDLSEDDSETEEAASTMGLQDHSNAQPMHVLPLYSMLPQAQQMRVFAPPPLGQRLCVVATNVAETSLTIPNIRYVIDTGKVKVKHYETRASISKFDVEWVSQASADQRAGRAGRTGPGHCYRLFSSAVFGNYFEKFADPEVLRLPIDGLVLQMKAMGIENVINFPFPTPPDSDALTSAEKLLLHLGALDTKGKITALGRTMSKFPVAPRFAKMLATAHQHPGTLPYIIAICAALTVGNIFVIESDVQENDDNNDDDDDDDDSSKEERPNDDDANGKTPEEKKAEKEKEKERLKRASVSRMKRRWVGNNPQSDLLTMLKAVGAFEFAGGDAEFCDTNLLRFKSMTEIRKLRGQLTTIVNSVFPGADVYIDPRMAPPNTKVQKRLWRIILSAYGDQVAKRVPLTGADESVRERRRAYQCDGVDAFVYLHPESALYSEVPDMVVYTEIAAGTKMMMKGATAVKPKWLAQLVPALCAFGKPLEQPSPRYDAKRDMLMCYISSTFGQRHVWSLPVQELPYPEDDANRYKVFARALLEGSVFVALKPMVPHLVAKPVLLAKAWTQERILVLLAALADNNICSRASLRAKWETDPRFLLSAYLLWVRPSHHNKVMAMWPPVKDDGLEDAPATTSDALREDDRDDVVLPSDNDSSDSE